MGCVAHTSSYSVATRALVQLVKRPVREFHLSPPSNTEVKNEWSYTSAPHMPFWRVQP